MTWTKAEARTQLAAIPYIPAKHQWAGHSQDLIVLHDMEAPENTDKTAEGVARYFETVQRTASAHYAVDRDSDVCCVKPTRRAAHAPGANARGIGIEQAGYARQTRAEWLDADSTRVLKRSSRIAALLCVAYDIPARWLSNAELKAGKRGLCHHLQCSQVFGGEHWDCGYGWPSDVFMAFVWGWLGAPSTPADLPEPSEAGMATIIHPTTGPDADHLWVAEGNVVSVLNAESDRQHLLNIGLLRQKETVEVPEAVFAATFHKFPGSP